MSASWGVSRAHIKRREKRACFRREVKEHGDGNVEEHLKENPVPKKNVGKLGAKNFTKKQKGLKSGRCSIIKLVFR